MNRISFRTVSFLSVLALAAAMIFGTITQTAFAQDKLDKSQLNTLISTAKTAAEHQRIADYYKAEAKDYLAQADEHKAMIAAYKANPSSKHQASLLTHCENLAADLKDMSAKSQELAQLHEKMASEAATK